VLVALHLLVLGDDSVELLDARLVLARAREVILSDLRRIVRDLRRLVGGGGLLRARRARRRGDHRQKNERDDLFDERCHGVSSGRIRVRSAG
jgi:hypothetical protein